MEIVGVSLFVTIDEYQVELFVVRQRLQDGVGIADQKPNAIRNAVLHEIDPAYLGELVEFLDRYDLAAGRKGLGEIDGRDADEGADLQNPACADHLDQQLKESQAYRI